MGFFTPDFSLGLHFGLQLVCMLDYLSRAVLCLNEWLDCQRTGHVSKSQPVPIEILSSVRVNMLFYIYLDSLYVSEWFARHK